MRQDSLRELADTNETLADLGNVNQSIAAAKRKLEAEFNQLGADLDEMTNEARLSEEKAARAMVDAARLADELRCEQDAAMSLEKDKKLLEAQCKDAAARADEDKKNHERMQALIDQLQGKVKSYKKQIEEAE